MNPVLRLPSKKRKIARLNNGAITSRNNNTVMNICAEMLEVST